jgi:tetratricopeptide (TPR) repeat protein
VLATGSIAGYHGAVDVLEEVYALAGRIAPPFPPPSTFTGADLVQLGYHSMLTSLGTGLTPAERRTFSDLLTKLDKAEGAFGQQLRLQGSLFPYSAFVATGDTAFLSMYRRWAGESEVPVAFQAHRALALGDTATAVRLSAQFSGVDTTKLLASSAVAFAPFVEAEVLADIGNLRGAAAIYESLDPKNFVIQGLDPRWALYIRSFLARGQLYQQLGERQKAEAAYQRFIELWANAHSRLQPQVQAARAALSQLRDAPPRR